MRSATFNAARCRELREARLWTMQDLAAEAGKYLGAEIHESTISKIETGKRQPSPKLFNALRRALRVSRERLLLASTPADDPEAAA
jgi:transcriptional regulator with XRE-family HTH domain